MSNLILPPTYRKHYAQMSTPIVFWFSKKLNHCMVPPHHSVPAPAGYERIECRHAHEVDKWSERLRQQEKRIHEMTLEERYNYEDPIRQHALNELRKNLQNARDEKNRAFLTRAIERLQERRDKFFKEVVDSRMACEAREGVAS